MPLDYCFDTSALCAKHTASLFDDPDRSALVAGLLASGRILITTINVIEACGCEDAGRRTRILRLQAELSRDFRPVLPPNELLKKVTLDHFHQKRTAEITISDDHSG